MKKTALSSNKITAPKAEFIGKKINSDIIDSKTKDELEEERAERKKKALAKKKPPTVVVPIGGGSGVQQTYGRRGGNPWARKQEETAVTSTNAELADDTSHNGEAGHNEDAGPGEGSTSGGVTTGKVTGTSATGKAGGFVRGHGIARTRSHKAKW